jgi:hypothetical protein
MGTLEDIGVKQMVELLKHSLGPCVYVQMLCNVNTLSY